MPKNLFKLDAAHVIADIIKDIYAVSSAEPAKNGAQGATQAATNVLTPMPYVQNKTHWCWATCALAMAEGKWAIGRVEKSGVDPKKHTYYEEIIDKKTNKKVAMKTVVTYANIILPEVQNKIDAYFGSEDIYKQIGITQTTTCIHAAKHENMVQS